MSNRQNWHKNRIGDHLCIESDFGLVCDMQIEQVTDKEDRARIEADGNLIASAPSLLLAIESAPNPEEYVTHAAYGKACAKWHKSVRNLALKIAEGLR